ncbi:hypothetical protein B0T20DRAFT_350032 [Sordaria brevicollis]|uniref:Uncharacterized protein n=1 Tax=Sordaria brevicollis TaxID=83679 RepID=A0AAE0PH74_SORBR|nr:hypothetical protein B0T20DRAFT_350032 [Sordaria brevicollis]
MRAKGGVSNSPLLRDLLNLVEVRLDDMKEVFVPLVSRITNTLMDVTWVEQKLTAMEVNGAGIFSRDDGMNGSSEGGSEADYTLSLFLVEFKSLLANLHALQKTFREHGILSYLSPFHSTVERLNSIEEMLLEEIELKTMTGKSSEVNEELLAKFQRVMKTWDTLGKMYEMDLKFANLRL